MKKIILLGISLAVMASCAPRRDETCSGSTQKLCEPSVYFAFDSAQINHVKFQNLDWAVEKINRWPDRIVILTGNTDLTGERNYNDTLAKKRAVAVGNELVRRGADPKKIRIKAMGGRNPITHEENLQHLNRRVDITFARKPSALAEFFGMTGY